MPEVWNVVMVVWRCWPLSSVRCASPCGPSVPKLIPGCQVALAGSGQAAGYRAGTGLQGHVGKLLYSLSDGFTLGVTYYLYELIDTPRVTGVFNGRDVTDKESHAHRVQVDAIWKF